MLLGYLHVCNFFFFYFKFHLFFFIFLETGTECANPWFGVEDGVQIFVRKRASELKLTSRIAVFPAAFSNIPKISRHRTPDLGSTYYIHLCHLNNV